MTKICIFDSKKTCNDCGECMICDLDRNKKCNNCGACLDTKDVDMKEIQIDEISDEAEEVETETYVKPNEEDTILKEDIADFELIDDIEGLEEIVEDLKLGNNLEGLQYMEGYPGLILKKK